jgi:hypothetical protein
MNLAEENGKMAYSIFEHETTLGPAWEQLTNQQRHAWRSVAQFFSDDADCEVCGSPLQCPDCDANALIAALKRRARLATERK